MDSIHVSGISNRWLRLCVILLQQRVELLLMKPAGFILKLLQYSRADDLSPLFLKSILNIICL